MLAALHVPGQAGYPALALVVAGQAMGLPLPGETALIASAVIAAREGGLDIGPVIAIAAASAVIGATAGYVVGRLGGAALLLQAGPLLQARTHALARGEAFFVRHGPRAVLLGRWISGVRIVIAPLAGINRMTPRSFLAWNLLAGVSWAATIGILAYLLGRRIVVLVTVMSLAALAWLGWSWWRHRRRAAGQ
ncbi:MAG: DedA family protein [Actinomycetota bacterium]|nr:DedA family protein [Actinomycetota bacterium]